MIDSGTLQAESMYVHAHPLDAIVQPNTETKVMIQVINGIRYSKIRVIVKKNSRKPSNHLGTSGEAQWWTTQLTILLLTNRRPIFLN